MRSLSHETILYRRLRHKILPMGYRSSLTALTWSTASVGCGISGTKKLQHGSPSGSQVCHQNCSASLHWREIQESVRSLLQHSLPKEVQHPSGFPCSNAGSFRGYRWIFVLLWISMSCKGAAWLTMLCTTGWREISSAWRFSSPSCTDLQVCRTVSLTQSHSYLWLQFLSIF